MDKKALYIKSGVNYRVTSSTEMDLQDALPPLTYVVKFSDQAGFYLSAVDNFTLPSKMYGTTEKNSARILNTFLSRPSATGALLCGEKGSGKTLLAKTVAVNAQKLGIPVLLVNDDHHGDSFNRFLQDIEQPVVVIFDEFEKVYKHEKQEHILTLLDGVFPTKKLFLITCNDIYRLDSNLKNRPGRIYYLFQYKGLDAGFIRDYCEDNLKDKSHINSLVKISTVFDEFNFDMLKACVEEMNRYNESPYDVLNCLNVKPEFSSGVLYDCNLTIEGYEVPQKSLYDSLWEGNPLNSIPRVYWRNYIAYTIENGKLEIINDDEFDIERANEVGSSKAMVDFSMADLDSMDAVQKKFVFRRGDAVFTMTKHVEKKYDIRAL